MPRWKKYSLLTLAAILVLMLLSMLVVPWQLKQQGSAWIAENTTRRLSIDQVFFNPFTLTIEVKGLQLSEADSEQTFVSLQRLMLSASSRSLIELALILDRVELDEPFVNIELLGKQEFNFSDFTRLGSDAPQVASKEPGKALQFSFNNIVLTDGKVDFTDQTSAKKSQHQIRELSLSVPFVGNIPYLTKEYVEPQLRLLLNGSEIRADGKLKPFDRSFETRLTLLLDEIDLAYYAYHSPVPLPVEINSGVLDTQIDLVYRVSSIDQPKLLLGGTLALTNIDIRELDGRELFRLPTLILELDWADLLQQDFNLLSLDLYQPELFINRNASGQWNFQRLLPATAETAAEEQQQKKSAPELPLLKAERVALHDGLVHLQDDYPAGGFHEEIQGINLKLDNFTTHRGELSALAFQLQTARELSLTIDGQLGLQPVTAELAVLMNGFLLQPHYPYLADLLTKPLAGTVNLASQVHFGADSNLRLQQAQLTLHDLLVPFGDQDQFKLVDFSVTGGSFDLSQQQLTLGTVRLNNGELVATRRADGSFTPVDLLRQKVAENTKPEPAAEQAGELPWQKKASQVETEGLKVAVNAVEIDQLNLQFTDASLNKKPRARIEQLSLSMQGLTYPSSSQSSFDLRGNIGKRGSFDFSGNLAHSPLRLQANTTIKALPLADFNDFVPENLNLQLKDGQLHSTLAVTLKETPEALTGSFAGRLNVSSFNLRDPLTSGELLAWENLDLTGIKGDILPFALQIEAVSLNNYFANILIDQDGKINLTSLTAEQLDAAEENKAIEPEPQTEVAASDSTPPPDIRIDALTLQGGTVSFTDRHLPSTFSTTMYELGGRITGLASAEEMQADVDLRGQLESHSPLTISGKLNPLSKQLFADLTIRFEDIDLAALTPYSGTYLGYVIDKGKLYLDLNYHIEHQDIKASNKIMIDQFTFGDSVKSDQATSLPVSLAIALLKDRRGEIHLDLPVSGNLDDPSFSIAGTILSILKNLLVKAATSPFSLLASLVGGGEDFSSVSFASGLDRLTETEQQKLAKVAEMLVKRPALTLEISAFVDRDQDPEAYRQEQLQQQLKAAKWLALKEEGQAPETPEQVVVSADEYPQLLTSVYVEAEFPRPRNFVGLLKTLPVAEMEKLLLANQVVGAEELTELAKRRALRVREALVGENTEIKPQIFLKKTDIYQPPKAGAASRVEFTISSK